ncbi:hypothetical protein WMF18_41630 [Sorangium sp. So ce315]
MLHFFALRSGFFYLRAGRKIRGEDGAATAIGHIERHLAARATT